MANRRKVLSLHTEDMTREKRTRRAYEESLISADNDELDTVPPSLFINRTAKNEYFRVLKELRKSVGILSNVNRSDLISYANSYARYVSCVKEMRGKDFQMVIQTENGPKENPICGMMDRARRDMAESSRRLGMTFDGMLKAAAVKADKQEAELEERFGGI